MILNLKKLFLQIDFQKGTISSLRVNGVERIAASSPLFRLRLRDVEGNALVLSVNDARTCIEEPNGALYKDFAAANISVRVYLTEENGEAAWRISAKPSDGRYFFEWVELAPVTLPALTDDNSNGNGGRVLFPYNEGVLISSTEDHDKWFSWYGESEYPSQGGFPIFPNMVCSQMLAYLWDDAGLYVGAHDSKRGIKDINIVKSTHGVAIRFRLFCGTDFGEEFKTDYPLIFSVTDGNWESAAERYRQWFECNLPPKAQKILENNSLPRWYFDSPLVISYPIRGTHDMDEMTPNAMYPYTNALPILDQIKNACDSRLLVLLMHWESTAPWAPPYVWPPFGDQDNFDKFMNTLHRNGDMLGVYCSGFGFTSQSNLIASYNKDAEYAKRELWRGMCAGPDGKVAISNICQGQRSGYDICPASEVGRAILDEAYEPLLRSELDYVQILDQNHGGGQYFCYSKEHGHAPAPGAWMTENMQNMLSDWNATARKMLLGCESAAAEAFIGNLLFSDNRYELNYAFGTPVPMYAYIYHEYVRNFMGNQVGCRLGSEDATLRYRLAYSFSSGDCMTLVLTPDGELLTSWGTRDFTCPPDKEKAFKLISNLTRFYRESASQYLCSGRMIPSPEIECESVSFSRNDCDRKVTLPALLHSAWEASDGTRALILVNPSEKELPCKVDGSDVRVPALNALKIML